MIDKTIAELKSAKIPFVIITVVKVRGSAPRHVGAKMIVTHEGKTYDTIGGGTLEETVIKDAKEFLRLRKTECKEYLLGPELGQCCGGDVELFFEPVFPLKRIIVFGAGHIAEALCPMLKALNFDITLVDERAERLAIPTFDIIDKKINERPDDIFNKLGFDDETHIIAITHQHKDDEKIVRYFLDKPCKYLGMIGSKHKWQGMKLRFKSNGFTDEQISRVVTPIGLGIGSETPFEIAVSIAAQLIKFNATGSIQ